MASLFGGEGWWPADASAGGAGCVEAGAGAFSDEVAFVFGEGGA